MVARAPGTWLRGLSCGSVYYFSGRQLSAAPRVGQLGAICVCFLGAERQLLETWAVFFLGGGLIKHGFMLSCWFPLNSSKGAS